MSRKPPKKPKLARTGAFVGNPWDKKDEKKMGDKEIAKVTDKLKDAGVPLVDEGEKKPSMPKPGR